ncbi:MAG TPA: hypothetical protein DDZ88_28740 [Verrucomicrobiales bacterium]|nr:hypothetical protein [Verrucomicrobiales bacterium]
MKQLLSLMICASAGLMLCQCSGTEGKNKKVTEMSLEQRAVRKPDDSQRSQYEKYLTDPKMSKGGAGTYFQKQMHHSKSFNGGNSYAGQKQFKTSQSWFGKSRSQAADMTYSLGDRQSRMGGEAFKADQSRFGSQQAREGSSFFSGAGDVFKTNSALTRAKGAPRPPKIIGNLEATSTTDGAYTEDQVRSLLQR